VSITDKREVFERGYTFTSAHVTEDIAQSAMQFLPEWELNGPDYYYGLTKKEGN